MKTWKLDLIGKNRQRVQELRMHPHVKACDCCGYDLDQIEEDPAGSFTKQLLADVEKRIAMAELTVGQ